MKAFLLYLFSLLFAWKEILALGQLAHLSNWSGPREGPLATRGKTVYFLASDFRNGGVAGVYRGMQTAAQSLGWKVRSFDGKGSPELLGQGLHQAIHGSHVDGIVFGGFQPDDYPDLVALAKKKGIVLIGWHAAEEPGPHKNLFVNIGTSSRDVAHMAADLVIGDGDRPKGIIILNDSRFAVANKKTLGMRERLRLCETCKLLAIEDISLADAHWQMAKVVPRLSKQFGAQWTHTLAINDLYFDHMNFPLIYTGRRDIINVAAGDGSIRALSRIRAGQSQQRATIAEPLQAQGWQVVDEFNRAFSGNPPSAYVSQAILVTTPLLKRLGNHGIETNMGFEQAYQKIWQKGPYFSKKRP